MSELCVAQGIPANLIDEYQFFGEGFEGRAGGNPDLDTETADTYTVGMVVSSWSNQHWLERLQVSLDWYRIEITGAIETVDATAFISRCYDAHFNPTFAPANTYCTFFDRDPATGDIREALEIYRNIGFLQTTGLDLQFDWSLDAGPGTFNINWLVAFVDSFESSDGPGLAAIDAAGRAGGSVGGALPEWKWNLRAGYAWSGFDASIEWRYVDAMGIVDPSYDWRIPSRSYYDATLGYAFEDGTLAGLSLMAGVENLTDTKPPVFPLYVQANTDPSQYDVLGRRYFLRANYRF